MGGFSCWMNVAALHGRVCHCLTFIWCLSLRTQRRFLWSIRVVYTEVVTAVDSSISEAKVVWARWCAIVLDLGLWEVTELSYGLVSGECVCMCACVSVCIFEAKTVCYVVLWVWWCGSCLRECFAVMVVCVSVHACMCVYVYFMHACCVYGADMLCVLGVHVHLLVWSGVVAHKRTRHITINVRK